MCRSGETRFPVPVLLVYALIDRPFILDLIPGNSFVEYLVQQGFDVYLLDWGVPGEEDRALLFDDYVFDYLAEAVGQVLGLPAPRRSPCSGPASGACSAPCTPPCSRALICGT